MLEILINLKKSTRLHLLFAYLLHEKLNNKYKALYELTNTEENKPNMQEAFSIHRYRNIIEEEMIETDSIQLESRSVDVNKIVRF